MTTSSDRRADAAFTLIELLTVVTIIGVLATITVPLFLSQREKAQNGSARADLRNLVTAEEAYLTASTAESYTRDVTALTNEGATLTQHVSHAVCLHDGAGSSGDSAYVAAAMFADSDRAYVYDVSVGTIVELTPVPPGADAGDVLGDVVSCPDTDEISEF